MDHKRMPPNAGDPELERVEAEIAALEARKHLSQRRVTLTVAGVAVAIVLIGAVVGIAASARTHGRDDASTGAECSHAVQAAAAVSAGQDANAELQATARACSTVDEWWNEIRTHPATFGVTSLPNAERTLYVEAVCVDVSTSPMCRDAKARGVSRY